MFRYCLHLDRSDDWIILFTNNGGLLLAVVDFFLDIFSLRPTQLRDRRNVLCSRRCASVSATAYVARSKSAWSGLAVCTMYVQYVHTEASTLHEYMFPCVCVFVCAAWVALCECIVGKRDCLQTSGNCFIFFLACLSTLF